MAQITVQKQLDGTTTKSVLTILETERTSEATTFELTFKTNLVSSGGYIGRSEGLNGIVEISGAEITTQTKTTTIKSTSESWSGTAVHTKNDTFEVTIPSSVSSINVKYTLKHTPSNDSVTGTTSMNLTKLASQIGIMSDFNVDDVNGIPTFTIPITKYVSTYYDVLNLNIYDSDEQAFYSTILKYDVENDDVIVLTPSIKNFIYSHTKNGNITDARFDIYTYSDSTMETLIGITTGNIVKATLLNANPTFVDFNYEDSNIITTALTGNNQIIVLGKSNLKITIPVADKAIGNKGATIENYFVDTEQVPYSSDSDVIKTINNYNKPNISASATDTRGNSTTIVKNFINLIEYVELTKNETTKKIKRENDTETQTKVSLEGTWWNDTFGVVNNSLTISYRYKIVGTSEWIIGDATSLNNGLVTNENNYSLTNIAIKGDAEDNGFLTANSYNIEITISDKLSSVVFLQELIAGQPAMKIKGNKVIEINGEEPQFGNVFFELIEEIT